MMQTNWSQKHRDLSLGKDLKLAWEVAEHDEFGGDDFTTNWYNKNHGPEPRHLTAIKPRVAFYTPINLERLRSQLQTARQRAQMLSQQNAEKTYYVVLKSPGWGGNKSTLVGCDSIWKTGKKEKV